MTHPLTKMAVARAQLNERSSRCIEVTISLEALTVKEKTLWNQKVQIVFGARHRDVEEAPFLFQFLSVAGGEIRWNATIDHVEDENRFPFLAFRRMDRGQDQVVLIKSREARLVTRGVRRIERKLGQEALTRRIAGRNLFKLNQISMTNFRVLMDTFQMRLIPKAREFEVSGPSGFAEFSNRLNKGSPIGTGSGRDRHIPQRCARVRAFRKCVQHTVRGCWPNTWKQLEDPKARNAIPRVLNETQDGDYVLDMGGLQELQATEFDEWNIATCQFDFERSAVRGGAEQDGLLFQQRALLPIRQNLLDHVARLLCLVANRN
jgi:hypothetical protein